MSIFECYFTIFFPYPILIDFIATEFRIWNGLRLLIWLSEKCNTKSTRYVNYAINFVYHLIIVYKNIQCKEAKILDLNSLKHLSFSAHFFLDHLLPGSYYILKSLILGYEHFLTLIPSVKQMYTG